MKYFLIFLISFVVITSAYAAKTVTGSVPVVQPLQPPAAGVAPDFNHDIESTAPVYPGQASSSNPQGSGQGQNTPVAQSSSATGQATSQPSKPNFLILLLLVVIGGAALVFALGLGLAVLEGIKSGGILRWKKSTNLQPSSRYRIFG